MSEWLPIESAPKDGSYILAFFLDEVIVAKWSAPFQCWLGANVKWHDDRQTFTQLSDGWGENGDPTHWMPLPPPPSDEYVTIPRIWQGNDGTWHGLPDEAKGQL